MELGTRYATHGFISIDLYASVLYRKERDLAMRESKKAGKQNQELANESKEGQWRAGKSVSGRHRA